MRTIVLTSLMTGGFCAIFAAGVDVLTDALSTGQVIILGAISGATGSFVAQMVTRGRR